MNPILAQVGFNSRYWLHCHSNVKVFRIKLKSKMIGDVIWVTICDIVGQKIKKICSQNTN